METRETLESLVQLSKAKVADSERRLKEDRLALAYLEGVLGSLQQGQTNIDDLLEDWNYEMEGDNV